MSHKSGKIDSVGALLGVERVEESKEYLYFLKLELLLLKSPKSLKSNFFTLDFDAARLALKAPLYFKLSRINYFGISYKLFLNYDFLLSSWTLIN